MYELIWVGENTYYIDGPLNLGVYCLGDGLVCLIDSGSDKDAAKKILAIIEGQGWTLDSILVTHSHADHMGGCHYLQAKTDCRILGPGLDRCVMEHPVLEPALLFGGYPPKALRNKFLMAKSCRAEELSPEALGENLKLLNLDGHSFSMAGIGTEDGVWFLADSVLSEELLEKHQVPFLFDVEAYLRSLDLICTLEGMLFIPAHAAPTDDIVPLVTANRAWIMELLSLIKDFTWKGIPFETLLKQFFDHKGMTMDFSNYALVGSTLRSCLSYLADKGEVETYFQENRLMWRTVDEKKVRF